MEKQTVQFLPAHGKLNGHLSDIYPKQHPLATPTIAPIPENEELRLKALREYHVLDSKNEESFDSLAKLASYICQTPVGLITLVDADRVYHKAAIGMEVGDVDRGLSFCQFAILHDEMMVVPDSLEDIRFKTSDFVTGNPYIRFYAGYPLTSESGHNVGSLCVVDQAPRKLNEEQETAMRTIARQVVAQLELRKRNFQLQDDLNKSQEAERDMKISKEIAEQTALAKDEFLANMSHEIRTPMNAIIGFTDLLNKTNLDTEQQEYLTAIKIAGESLLSIINDILDLSKIESGALTFENTRFDVLEVLKNTKSLLLTKAEEKLIGLQLLIDSEVPRYITGDGHRLSQILINLIGNALKFTEKGNVTISTDTCEFKGQQAIRISIKDTGIGIPQDKLEVIFERFTQANTNTTRKYGGTGLGLNISRLLVELQGGQIEVSSKEGVGSEFSFILPYAPANQDYTTIDHGVLNIGSFTNNKYRILLCEDNVLNQRLAKAVLTQFGFTIEIAENGKIGLEKLRNSEYDLILMDLQMPEMDGYQTTVAIRTELGLKTPIMAMTAHSLVGEKEKCMQVGMNDYIPKPFRQQELFEKISSLLGIRAQQKSAEPVKLKTAHSYVDFAYLREISGNNADFEREMIATFIEHTPKDLEELEVAIQRRDWPLIGKLAHKMKSSLHIVGAHQLIESMHRLEMAAIEHPDPMHLHGFTHTATNLRACIEELQNL